MSALNTVFTVEQVELIRRLRLTGIRPQLIVQAYESLDRIEEEFSRHQPDHKQIGIQNGQKRHLSPEDANSYTPSSKRISHSPLGRTVSDSRSVSGSGSSDQHGDDEQSPDRTSTNPILLQHLTQHASGNGHAPVVEESAPVSSSMSIANLLERQRMAQVTSSLTSPTLQHHQQFNHFRPNISASHMSSPNILSNMLAATAPRLYGPRRTPPPLRPEVAEFTNIHDPSELEQFVKKGEDTCINEIKSFVSQLQLRQTTVAQMTGISQPYVSKFLNGNYRELSLRVRHLIFKWYLNCQKKPERLAQFVSEPARSLPMIRNTAVNFEGSMQLMQRRERYVFRPIMIPIMERHFRDNPYPDLEKRMEIAAECNRGLQMEKRGTPVLSKELVSPQIIANWFANKRKDMKRRHSDDAPGLALHMVGNPSMWGNDSPSPVDDIRNVQPHDQLSSSVLATQYAQLLAQNLQNLANMGEMTHPTMNGSCGTPTPNGSSDDNDNGKSTPPEDENDTIAINGANPFHTLQNELAAVSNSVLALVNPYGEDEVAKEKAEKQQQQQEHEQVEEVEEEETDDSDMQNEDQAYANHYGHYAQTNGQNHYGPIHFGQENGVKSELVATAD